VPFPRTSSKKRKRSDDDTDDDGDEKEPVGEEEEGGEEEGDENKEKEDKDGGEMGQGVVGKVGGNPVRLAGVADADLCPDVHPHCDDNPARCKEPEEDDLASQSTQSEMEYFDVKDRDAVSEVAVPKNDRVINYFETEMGDSRDAMRIPPKKKQCAGLADPSREALAHQLDRIERRVDQTALRAVELAKTMSGRTPCGPFVEISNKLADLERVICQIKKSVNGLPKTQPQSLPCQRCDHSAIRQERQLTAIIFQFARISGQTLGDVMRAVSSVLRSDLDSQLDFASWLTQVVDSTLSDNDTQPTQASALRPDDIHNSELTATTTAAAAAAIGTFPTDSAVSETLSSHRQSENNVIVDSIDPLSNEEMLHPQTKITLQSANETCRSNC
jgi:hypothetical protein